MADRVKTVSRLAHHSQVLTSRFMLLLLTLGLIVEGVLSIDWRMEHDTPLLHYAAFLIDQDHYVPYRDIFETSMPGTFLFHLAIVKLLGYSDLAFRWVDIAWLSALLATTGAIMYRFGRSVAWASMVLFGLSYFQHGPSMSLQRDYVALLPIALAVLFAFQWPPGQSGWAALVIGGLFGVSATVKPQLAVGLPCVLLFMAAQLKAAGDGASQSRRWLKLGGWAAVGLSLPLIGVALWLYFQGAWPYFWEMSRAYLPLHLSLTRTHQTIAGWARVGYLVETQLALGGLGLWLLPAALGVYLALFEASLSAGHKRRVFLLVSLAGVYGLYPAISGQFFRYHWMPFQYFIIVLSGLVLIALPEPSPALKKLFPTLLLLASLYLIIDVPPGFMGQLEGYPPPAPKGGRVDEIAGYLKAHLKEGDRVQALDWTGGAVHAMLLARAPLATSFLYDYHFYHHVSNPYIQTLRLRFLDQFKRTKPRFVVEVTSDDKPWVGGDDTTTDFNELRAILQDQYLVATEGNGYVIYELQQ